IAGPAASIEPPFAGTWFTVSKSLTVLKSHRILPSTVEYARRWPSTDPEKTTPGITDAGADCAPVQPRPVVHSSLGAGASHTRSPVASFTACSPPASLGADRTSDTGTYAFTSSAADPHSMPPSMPPLPARYCQSTLPSLSGSSPQSTPDFWPATMTRLPPGSVRRIGALPKSKSGPTSFGQFSTPGRQPTRNASDGVTWFHQTIFPVLRSMAITESLVLTAGPVYELPVPMYRTPRCGSIVGAFHTAAPAGAYCAVPFEFFPV